jgi:hypothetical protein
LLSGLLCGLLRGPLGCLFRGQLGQALSFGGTSGFSYALSLGGALRFGIFAFTPPASFNRVLHTLFGFLTHLRPRG